MEKDIKLLSIREVAKRTDFSEHTLRQLSREGRLPQIKLKSKVLINYTKLLEMLDKGEL